MLFKLGRFTSHSGLPLDWKVEADALGAGDWEALALMASRILPPFGQVEGVPTGGLPFAESLRRHATEGPLLIADDVCTSGRSMEVARAGREAIGVVAFARGPVPPWVRAVCTVNEALWSAQR